MSITLAAVLFPFACISAGVSVLAWVHAFSTEHFETSLMCVLIGYATALMAAFYLAPMYQLVMSL